MSQSVIYAAASAPAERALFDALDALPWGQVPIAHTATDKGHGRITTRTIQVLPAPEDLPFPHVSQVFLIERYVTGLRGQPISAVAALGVASPEPGQANAVDLAGYEFGRRSRHAGNSRYLFMLTREGQ